MTAFDGRPSVTAISQSNALQLIFRPLCCNFHGRDDREAGMVLGFGKGTSDELLKEILSNKKLKEFMQDRIDELVERFDKRDLTPEETKELYLSVTEQVKDKSLRGAFADELAYHTYILRTVLRAAEFKERGVVLSNYYLPNAILYFPYDKKKKQPQIATPESGGEFLCFTTKAAGELDNYTFYLAGKPGWDKSNCKSLKMELDRLWREPPNGGEAKAFLRYVRDNELDVEKVTSLIHHADNYFIFGSYSSGYDLGKITYSDTAAARTAISDDLRHLLTQERL